MLSTVVLVGPVNLFTPFLNTVIDINKRVIGVRLLKVSFYPNERPVRVGGPIFRTL